MRYFGSSRYSPCADRRCLSGIARVDGDRGAIADRDLVPVVARAPVSVLAPAPRRHARRAVVPFVAREIDRSGAGEIEIDDDIASDAAPGRAAVALKCISSGVTRRSKVDALKAGQFWPESPLSIRIPMSVSRNVLLRPLIRAKPGSLTPTM